MKKFKVIVLSLSGLGNKIFESGDVVNEDAFPEGSVGKLVKEGFLVPYDSDENEKSDLENSNANASPEDNSGAEPSEDNADKDDKQDPKNKNKNRNKN